MGQLELIASTPAHRQANTHTHTNTHTHIYTHTHIRARAYTLKFITRLSPLHLNQVKIFIEKIPGIIHTTLTKYGIPYPREKEKKKEGGHSA